MPTAETIAMLIITAAAGLAYGLAMMAIAFVAISLLAGCAARF